MLSAIGMCHSEVRRILTTELHGFYSIEALGQMWLDFVPALPSRWSYLIDVFEASNSLGYSNRTKLITQVGGRVYDNHAL